MSIRASRRVSLALMTTVLAVLLHTAAAQDGGQFWVRAFEDRNGNGVRDSGEPFLTRSVAVDLLNAESIVIDSKRLDESPDAAQGWISFTELAPGDYTVVVTSPELTPTTPDRFTRTLDAGAARPTVVEFGARRSITPVPNTIATPDQARRDEIARIALSGLGAVITAGFMTALGVLVYLLLVRPRLQRQLRKYSTGAARAVPQDNTPRSR